jgi:hypothetical protein
MDIGNSERIRSLVGAISTPLVLSAKRLFAP